MIKIMKNGMPSKELLDVINDSYRSKAYIETAKHRDEELHDLLKNEGFEYSRGGSRDIYIKGEFALKLARNKSGYRSNEYEEDYYKKSKKKKYLAKVYKCDKKYRWLVMERVKIPSHEQRKKHAEKLRSIIYKDMESTGFEGKGDINFKNVGVKGGVPKVLDYGGGILVHPRKYRVKR